MTKAKRFLFQVILWWIIWLILSIAQNFELLFIVENLPVYVIQISLITFLIYYAAPLFFVEKKYVYFVLISLLIIVFSSLFIAFFLTTLRGGPPELLHDIERGLKPPIFIHLTQGLLLSVAYLLGLFIEGIYFLQKKEQEAIISRNEALQSELKLLKSQINPHFLFNTLNNIYALAAFDASKTQQSISYLSDMLRYVLYECERPFVSPQKEVKYLENYIKLFSLKSSKKYPIKLETQIVDSTINIAPMVLIPFVENAIKHSYIERIKDAFIHIFLKVTAEQIHFKIENSIPEKSIQKDGVGGIGLENVRKRLAIIYPNNHELLIKEDRPIFKVELTIKSKKDV